MTADRYYKDLDKAFFSIVQFLDGFPRSQILLEFAQRQFVSFFYASVIVNVFRNLTRANIGELGLPTGQIGNIRPKLRCSAHTADSIPDLML